MLRRNVSVLLMPTRSPIPLPLLLAAMRRSHHVSWLVAIGLVLVDLVWQRSHPQQWAALVLVLGVEPRRNASIKS